MKAKFPSRCLFCVGENRRKVNIVKGEEILPHPSVSGRWVHAWHLKNTKHEEDVQKQLRLF